MSVENRKTKIEKTQQVVDRLGDRWLQGHGETLPECELGREPPTRRGGPCSACTIKPEFELDREITRLVAKKAFGQRSNCPYRVFSNNLLFGMTLGPEAGRARSAKPETIDPIHELTRALIHVAAVLRTTTQAPADIEALDDDEEDDSLKALKLVT